MPALNVDFEGKPAFFIPCPVCGDRHVGGAPDEDPATEAFMREHSMWHANGNRTSPPHANANVARPGRIVLPGG